MSKKINFIFSLLVFSNCVQRPAVIVEDPIGIEEVQFESNDKIKTKPAVLSTHSENVSS